MKPQLHHFAIMERAILERREYIDARLSQHELDTVVWYDNMVEDMRLIIRELLQYCNNTEVAQKAWKLLDIVEVGE